MFVLDCDTSGSTMNSLCSAFRCSPSRLENVLLSIDIEKHYEEHWETISVSDYLYDYVVQCLGAHEFVQTVMWFHATRTLPSNNFLDGVLTLSEVLPKLWASLIQHAPDDETRIQIKEVIENDNFGPRFRHKITNDVDGGPFGVLVKDVILSNGGLNHGDYLGMPEIIEDAFGCIVASKLKPVLVPKIVKFRARSEYARGEVFHALNYLYNAVRGQPPGQSCVYCFDGEGVAIQTDRIEYVAVQDL